MQQVGDAARGEGIAILQVLEEVTARTAAVTSDGGPDDGCADGSCAA